VNQYQPNKRQREMEQARKQREKNERRMQRRNQGPGDIEVVNAADLQRGLPSVEEAMAAIEQRSRTAHVASSIPAKLFVGGIADEVTEKELHAEFERFGPVADLVIMVDRETRARRGFGFVTMANRKDAAPAIAGLDGYEMKGRSLAVNVATERR